jgi:glyoxylase-like metal-dependent hydrolase (beta-lactamase superfamily II)
MYVGSPGGHLETYFRSLRRLRGMAAATLFPSHGPPGHDAAALIDKALSHRLERIEEVYKALGPQPLSVQSLAERIYRDADPKLRPFFVRTTRAALNYLQEQGRAESAGEDLFLRKS